MPAYLAIALKDLRVLVRDPMALFWVLAFPVLFGLFFGSIMKIGPEDKRASIEVVLVQARQAEGAQRVQQLAGALRESGLSVTIEPQQAARDAVRRGHATMLIELPAPGELVPIQIGIDPSRSAEAAMATGALKGALLRGLAGSAVSLPPIETSEIAAQRQGPSTGYQAVFPAMVMWGLLGCAAAFAVALVSERSSGTLLRLYAAPCGRSSIVAGKALACALACLGATALLSAVGVWVLGVTISDPLKYVAAISAASACFVGLTQLLSVLGKSEQSVAGAGWSVLIVLAMCGGAMVPKILMPDWLVSLGQWSPVSWSILALEGATFRALEWSLLWKPLALCCGLGALCFAAATLVLRTREA